MSEVLGRKDKTIMQIRQPLDMRLQKGVKLKKGWFYPEWDILCFCGPVGGKKSNLEGDLRNISLFFVNGNRQSLQTCLEMEHTVSSWGCFIKIGTEK